MPQHWFNKEVAAEWNPILECHKKKFKEIEVHLFALEFQQEQQQQQKTSVIKLSLFVITTLENNDK